ncbi:MAG: amidohydrolase [Victivallales bacterium]|nr:amidohydrolase [Victivallales bacterium]
MLAITNGMLWPMDSPPVPDGTVLIDGGRIVEVGQDLPIPAAADVLDAAGRVVMPGLIDAHSHLGMWESLNGDEGADGNEGTHPITPQMRAVDGFCPSDITVREAREAGVTCVAITPGSANVIGGTAAVVKTAGHRVDDMVVRDPVAMKCAFGKNPKSKYGGAGKAPATRMAIAALIRETMEKARRYQQRIEAAKDAPDSLPDYDAKLEALLPVLRRQIPLKCHAHRADDMFTALRLAREFDLRITLDHATDGALIAADLAREGVACIVGPSFGHRSKYELQHKSFRTAGVLAAAGVKIAITTDAPVTPQDSLPIMAGLAARDGLPEEQALLAITRWPAEILGIDDRVGTLAVGKDADVVVFDGHPLHLGSRPWRVFVNGQAVHQEE